MSGVPQGSVLGPILFLIYINDLDDDITSKVLKFADDTKVFRKIKSDADRQHLQDDLNKLIEWSEKWQMLFNFGKCKCLHTGHGNEDAQYTMGDTVLNTTLKEKDLGLTISADMKVSEQCGIAAAKGNQILGLIRRNIVYKEKELLNIALISFAQLHTSKPDVADVSADLHPLYTVTNIYKHFHHSSICIIYSNYNIATGHTTMQK